MIEITDLSYTYRDGQQLVPALREVSLHIRKGEWVALTGPNGSGKSTLIRMMNGLLTPATGQVSTAGLRLDRPAHREQVKDRVQIVFQNPSSQMIGGNPLEDISFGLESRGMGRAEMRLRIQQALDQVGLSHKLFANVATLSGGQQQRLAIASCLALRPECIIFDEATSMLDPKGRKQVYAIARQLWQTGTTVIWVSQRPQEMLEADRIVLMEQGGITFDGNAHSLFYESGIPTRLKWDLPPIVKIGLYLQETGALGRKLPLSENDLEGLLCTSNLVG
jgi:energy-coupling factor transport system ATP-binding protein